MNVDDIENAPHTCCICRKVLTEYPIGANNPNPVVADGKCCNSCNEIFVIPAREKA